MTSTATDRLAGLTTSVAVKAPCRLKTTANHALSGLVAIDGVTPVAGDRILVGSNTDASENGIYNANSSDWTRALDFDGSLDAVGGTQVSINEGTVNEKTYWRVAGDGAVVIETDDIEFEEGFLSSSGAIIFNQGGTGAVSTTVQAELRLLGLRPEQFGAVGNGTADDSAAILAAIVQQQATGVPITFTPGATYGIGATSWTGLSVTLTRNLEIYGNGATLKNLVAASQSAVAGAVFPSIKIDGTNANRYLLKIHGLNVNLNAIKEPVFAPYRCTLDIEGCYAYGGEIGSGGIGDASIFIYANLSTGRFCGNNSKNCPYPFYGGHTDANMACYDLVMTGNRGTEFHTSGASTYRGDPYNGVVHGMTMADNIWSNFFGIGFSGVAANSTVSYNVTAQNNVLSDYSGSGFQTDNIGSIYSYGFNIDGNIINDAVAAANPLYFPKLIDSRISGNQGKNCRAAIVIDDSAGGVVVEGNHFELGTSTPAGIGISLVGQVAATAEIDVLNNRMESFAVGIYVGGAGFAVSNVNVIGNTTIAGTNGLRIDDTVTGIFVDGNDFAGGSTVDINNTATNGQLGVQFGLNKFATASGVAQVQFVAAPAPTAKNADATLTIAELLTGIITTTNSAAVALTLPTGTLTAGGFPAMAIGQAFDWTHVNLGSASGAMTLTAGVDHTIVGNAVVAISTSARFRTRKTAATTYVTYRIS